eukprot:CAMPEP_0168607684 /NCGR_PEP_ID=MMETSP0449_2-20121227/193_1 /TAXON_ID=1082188 /ORGANISM="Strombidium rassoulzadegani, Strain ras09" /LENGTH=82 /DNA_ID=CAMNT_0008647555 /DNA_START=518 /DNA_END=766 /DNA_ORIENTATION=+
MRELHPDSLFLSTSDITSMCYLRASQNQKAHLPSNDNIPYVQIENMKSLTPITNEHSGDDDQVTTMKVFGERESESQKEKEG